MSDLGKKIMSVYDTGLAVVITSSSLFLMSQVGLYLNEIDMMRRRIPLLQEAGVEKNGPCYHAAQYNGIPNLLFGMKEARAQYFKENCSEESKLSTKY